MGAMVLPAFGAPLREHQLPRPIPSPGEVLVRIAASGVNPLDVKIRSGQAAHAQVTPPFVLGIDLAGTVEEIGPGVDRFTIGDAVFGMTGGVGDHQGSLAQWAAVDAELLARKPERLSMREAAALPLAAISAWEGLVDRAAVRDGDVVLVHGGAGGVGTIAVQLAASRGATVYATASPRSFDAVRAAGARPIDRDTPVASYVAQMTEGEGFDVIFDTVGGPALDDSFAAVRRYTGHVVSILGWGSHMLAPLSLRGATYSGVFTLLPLLTGQGREHHREILCAIADLVDAGAITPRLSEDRYGWSTIENAHDAVTRAEGHGKIVIEFDENPS